MKNASKTIADPVAAGKIRASCIGHAFIALLVGIGVMAYAAMQPQASITFSSSLAMATTFFVGAAIFFHDENERPGSGWPIMAFYGRSVFALSMAWLAVSLFAAKWLTATFALFLGLVLNTFVRNALHNMFDREAVPPKEADRTRSFLTTVSVIQSIAFTIILRLIFR